MEELKLIRDNYWATKDGRIYSTKRNRYLKQRVGPRGYMMVNLSKMADVKLLLCIN